MPQSSVSGFNVLSPHPFASLSADGRIRRWAAIPEAEGRILGVVLLADGETVHNAFFDRSFKP